MSNNNDTAVQVEDITPNNTRQRSRRSHRRENSTSTSNTDLSGSFALEDYWEREGHAPEYHGVYYSFFVVAIL